MFKDSKRVGFPQKKLLAFKRIAKSIPRDAESDTDILQAFGWRRAVPGVWKHDEFGVASTREAYARITKEFHLLEIIHEYFARERDHR
jgi:hypothetical protein